MDVKWKEKDSQHRYLLTCRALDWSGVGMDEK